MAACSSERARPSIPAASLHDPSHRAPLDLSHAKPPRACALGRRLIWVPTILCEDVVLLWDSSAGVSFQCARKRRDYDSDLCHTYMERPIALPCSQKALPPTRLRPTLGYWYDPQLALWQRPHSPSLRKHCERRLHETRHLAQAQEHRIYDTL